MTDTRPPSTRITGALRRVRQRPSTLEVDAVHSVVASRLFGKGDRAPRLGRYRLRRRVGAGGLGVVYEALDPELDRNVAIKLMRQRDSLPDDAFERFAREASAMARVSHPSVVAVFDVGRYDHGDVASIDGDVADVPDAGVFIVMELVDGQDLQAWLATPHPVADVLRVFLAAGRGLAAAHAVEIVHRDFKPANVIVTATGAKVLDFGLARLVGALTDDTSLAGSHDDRSLGSSPSLTRTGVVMGTPAYMAPEQHAGEAVDARADQYAFCVALTEALLHTRLFRGDTIAAMYDSKLAFELPRDARIPRRLRAVLARGLRPNPEDRFRSMDALLAELAAPSSTTRRIAWGTAIGLVALAIPGVRSTAVALRVPPVVVPELAAEAQVESEDLRRDDISEHDLQVGELIGEGRNHEVVALGEALLERARAEDDPLLRAWSGYWTCHGYMRLEDYGAAASACEGAYDTALELGHTMLAAKAAAVAGECYARDGDPTALLWQRHAVAMVERGDLDPYHAAYVLDGVGTILDQFGQDPTAIQLRGIEMRERAEGPDARKLVPQLHNYVRALVHWDRPADAEPVARRMLDIATRTLGTDTIERVMAEQDLGETLCLTERMDDGLVHLNRAVELFDAHFIDVHPTGLAGALKMRGRCLASVRRWSDAIADTRRAVDLHRNAAVRRYATELELLVAIARWWVAAGDTSRARQAYREALDVVDPDAAAPPLRAEAQAELAALAGHEASAEAAGGA